MLCLPDLHEELMLGLQAFFDVLGDGLAWEKYFLAFRQSLMRLTGLQDRYLAVEVVIEFADWLVFLLELVLDFFQARSSHSN